MYIEQDDIRALTAGNAQSLHAIRRGDKRISRMVFEYAFDEFQIGEIVLNIKDS